MTSRFVLPLADVGAGLTPSSGAQLFFYETGTTTPKDTYSDAAGTIPNTNPVVANDVGVFDDIFISGTYKVVLKNSDGVQQWSADPVESFLRDSQLNDQYVLDRATLAAATADTTMKAGYAVNLAERTTGNGGGGMWDVIAGTGTANGYNIVAHDTLSLSFVLRVGATLFLNQWGVSASNTVANNTLAAQACIDYAATNGLSVSDSEGVFNFSTLTIKNGINFVNMTSGTWTPSGSTNPDNLTTEAAIVFQGAQTGGTIVSNARLSINLDMQNGDRTAILCDGMQDSEITGCNIYGFTNDATYNHRGIRLQDDGVSGANRNKIHNNRIVGYSAPTQLGLLIEVWGIPGAVFAGFFSGTVVDPSLPSLDNLIHDNTLINGSYAVNLQAAEDCIVYGNICRSQNHRSIYVANGSRRNIITNNQLLNYTSSAIVLGYGARDNIFSDNQCITGVFAGEAAVNISTGSTHNLISNNYIDSATNYGVYNGTDSSFTNIIGNHIKNFYLAGVQVENDIIDISPTNATYIRPNYADPDEALAGATSWTYNDTDGVVIQDNTFYYGYTGRSTAAISIAQIQNSLVGANSTEMKNTTIKNNTVVGMTNIAYYMFIYEHVAGKQTQVRCEGNTGNVSVTIADFVWFNPSGSGDVRNSIVYSESNEILDRLTHDSGLTFTDADTTPSVIYWDFFKCANTGATSITDFDDPYEGQQILVRLDSNTTIVHNATLIRTISGANITGTSNTFIRFISIGGIWIETT